MFTTKNIINSKGLAGLAQHAIFWIAFYIYDGPVTSRIEADPDVQLKVAAMALPLKIVATYFTLYFLNKIVSDNKKILQSILILLISILFFGIAQRTISYKIIYPLYYPDGLNHALLYMPKVIIEIFGVYSVVAIVATIHFIKSWYVSQQEQQLLRNEKLNAELKFLKAQIHPHFLFNTLNNLYTLTITNPEKAPEVVYKLSQLMSYMLYESNKQFVPLQMEIDHTLNYISLEKIRYDERLDIAMDILSDVKDIHIAPLLIMPFVENSFKHGFSNEVGKVWVHITILVDYDKLVIKIENTKGKADHINISDEYKGVGLSNVQKRLDLIYKENHELQIIDDETFLIILKINLPEMNSNKNRTVHEMLGSR